MKPAQNLKTAPKKTKRDLFTLSTENLELVNGGQGIINTAPTK
jgi:hypothetical protein